MGDGGSRAGLPMLTVPVPGEAAGLNDIGWCHARLGDYEQALTFCEQVLKTLRETGGGGWEANILDSLGYIHHHQSIACYQHAVDIYRDLGGRPEEAQTLDRLGDVRHSSGDTEAGRRAWLGALHIFDEIDHPDANKIRTKLQSPDARPEPSSA